MIFPSIQSRGVASFPQIRTCVLEKLRGFFKDFLLQVKAICSSCLPRIFKIVCTGIKNTTVLVVKCDRFETFLECLPTADPTIHCVFKTIVKESTLADYHSFWDLSGKFSHSKAFRFFSFFFSHSINVCVLVKMATLSPLIQEEEARFLWIIFLWFLCIHISFFFQF